MNYQSESKKTFIYSFIYKKVIIMNFIPQASVSEWAGLRKAVGAALFITYFVYFAVYYFASFKQNERPKLFVQM